MDTDVQRREFTSVTDALLAQRAELFISQQPNGAGSWPDDESTVEIPNVQGGSPKS